MVADQYATGPYPVQRLPGLNADMNNVDNRAVGEALASLLHVTEQAELLTAE